MSSADSFTAMIRYARNADARAAALPRRSRARREAEEVARKDWEALWLRYGVSREASAIYTPTR